LKLEGVNLQGNGSVARIKGVETAPANFGKMCAKGAQLGPTINTPDRMTWPLIRNTLNEELKPVNWDAALAHAAARFSDIYYQHGPDSVAFYGSGQLDTESVYIATKLFKGTLGCNNTDSNSRLCMAAAVAGYKTSLGQDGPPTCYDDINHADVMLIIGSNMDEAHPVTFERVKAARKSRKAFVIVADPRRTSTAENSDLHLAVSPGGDIALLNAIARKIVDLGAVDTAFAENHTNGYREFREFLLAQDLAELCQVAGVPLAMVEDVARRIAGAKGFLSFYCMGLNQSTVGMWKNNAVINLHLLTGQIGRAGAGPFSLTGQPNAMGGREAGMLSNSLPGYRTVDNPDHRAEVESYWGRVPGTISPTPGLTAVELFRAMEKGSLKAIWIAATNPAVSLPDLHHIRRAFGRAELVIVSDAYHPTETTRFAHVVLPAAQWGEKDWTSTNSERMVSHSPKLWNAPGQSLPDWEIMCRFANRMRLPGFQFQTSAEVWNEFAGLTRGRPNDVSGATAERLREVTSMQWPIPTADHPGTPRLYTDLKFHTPDGRAKFLCRDHKEPREQPDHEFPFVLTTGRLYSHWHTLTRTGKVDKLMAREPSAYVEINPADAEKLDLTQGDMMQISSRRGTIQLPARIGNAVPPGTVFIPFHWGDIYNEGNAANYLTISAIGRVAKQPELKFCAVSLEKVLVPSARRPVVTLPLMEAPPIRGKSPAATKVV